MIARAAVALAFAIAAMLAFLVTKVMAWNVLAGTLLASVLIGTAVLYAAYRLIATGKGQHVAPRGWNDGLRPLPVAGRVIPRAAVMSAPPWEELPPPDACIIAAGTLSGGQLTSMRVGVIPALPPSPDWAPRPALPEYAAKALKHPTVDEAVESIASRAMFLELNALLSKDAS